MSNSHPRIWRCTCHGGHFLSIALSPFHDEPEAYFLVEDYHPASLCQRLALAWRSLRGKPHGGWFEVFLDLHALRDMHAEIGNVIVEAEQRLADRRE